MSEHQAAIEAADDALERAKKSGNVSAMKGILEHKAKLLGLFKDESGGENFIINLDLDHSQVCWLKDKNKQLEEELLAVKAELAEYKKIYGGIKP